MMSRGLTKGGRKQADYSIRLQSGRLDKEVVVKEKVEDILGLWPVEIVRSWPSPPNYP